MMFQMKKVFNHLHLIVVKKEISVKFLLVLLLSVNSVVFAQKNSKIGEIKGVDFKLGIAAMDLTGNDATKIYAAIVQPDLEKNGRYPNSFKNGRVNNYCGYIYLGLAIKNQNFQKSKKLKNIENRFGINLIRYGRDVMQCDVLFDNDTSSSLINGIITYLGYGLNADFTLNSRPFFKDFATYAGIGTSVMLHDYKAVNGAFGLFGKTTPTIIGSIRTAEMTNTKITISSLDFKFHLGIKYNFSCDLNLFLETSMGGSYYHKGLYGNHKWLSNSNITLLGMRYKFVNANEQTKTSKSVYW